MKMGAALEIMCWDNHRHRLNSCLNFLNRKLDRVRIETMTLFVHGYAQCVDDAPQISQPL